MGSSWKAAVCGQSIGSCARTQAHLYKARPSVQNYHGNVGAQKLTSSQEVPQATSTFSQLSFYFWFLGGQELLIIADEDLLFQDFRR